MFKKNTAVTGFQIGHFIQTADGAAKTTGTPSCKRLLDGTPGTLTNAASYDSTAGVWKIDLAAGDVNGDMVGLSFTLADCLPIGYTLRTTTKLVSDLNDAASAPSAATNASAVRTELTTELGRIDAAVSTRSTYAGGDTSGTTTLLSRVVGTLATGTHNPQSGDAYARLGAPNGASVSADVASIKTDTGTTIPGRLPTALTAGGHIKADTLAISGDTGAADNAEAFFDGTGYTGSNNILGFVGEVLGNVGGTVASVTGDIGGSVEGSVRGDVDGSVGSIAASGIDSAAFTTATLNAIADAILKRDWSGLTGEASRSLLNALRFLRNKWSVSGSTLTVTKEDDATTAWTATLTSDVGADPVTGSDPT